MKYNDFQKAITDYDLSEKAQNVLIINDINNASFFLSVTVKKLYYTERKFKQTMDELSRFQNILKQKNEERREKVQLTADLIGVTKKKDTQNKRLISIAIEEFIDTKGLPQKRQAIIQQLAGEFPKENIIASLSNTTRFKNIGSGYYDRLQSWENRSCIGLIKLLPDPVSEFAKYFVNLNKNSYTLVFALLFIQNMNDRGSIDLMELKDMFYDFYLSRHKKGFVVEANTSVMNRIGKLKKSEIKNLNCTEGPLSHFIFSEFFQNPLRNKRIYLKYTFNIEFYNTLIRDKILITFLKAIDDYYQIITPKLVFPEQISEPPIEIQKFDVPKSKEDVQKPKERYSTEGLSDDPLSKSINDYYKRKAEKLVSSEQEPEIPIEIQKPYVPKSKENSGPEALPDDSVTTPQRRFDISQHLGGESTSKNIPAVLSDAGLRFKSTGDGFYDLPENLQQMSCKELIDLLPVSVTELVQYLVSRNYNSYMLVMVFVFIRNMEEDFSIYIPRLNEMFYDFYLSRHKNNLVIEIKTAVVNRVNELTKNEIKDIVCPSVFGDLLDSRFFKNISHGRFNLKNNLANELVNTDVKSLMLITLRKAIDEYYQKISPKMVSFKQIPEPPLETQKLDPPKFKEDVQKPKESYSTEALSDDPVTVFTDQSIIDKEKLEKLKKTNRIELINFVRKTNLSVRGMNVILGNCNSVEDCCSLNQETLLTCSNCGRKTVCEILDFLQTMDPEYTSQINLKKSKHDELVCFIKKTDLSVRAINVVLHDCSSIEDCFLLNQKALLACQNCGKKTADEILDLIEKNKPEGDFLPSPAIKKQLGAPPTEESLSLLPIFSSTTLEGLSAKDLHPAFKDNSKLSDLLLLSVRVMNVLDIMGLKTVGDILFTPGSKFLKRQNFGRNSLKEIKRQIHSLYFSKQHGSTSFGDDTISIDFTSYDNMISSFTAVCVKDVRNQGIFQKKLCFQSEKTPTLEEIGQIFGITRERVRQIVKKELRKFKHKININKLEYFWEKIDGVVDNGGGIIHLGELPEVLQTKFNWPKAPHYLALGELLALRRSKGSYKNSSDLITTDCECPSCEQVFKQLNELDFTENKTYHVEVLAIKLKDYCQTHCSWKDPVKTFHKAFIEHLIYKTDGCLRLQDDIVMSRNKWIETHCNKLEDLVCYVLEVHGKPMHFSEIAKQIRKHNINFKEVSDHNVHASIARYDTIKISSRGTFGLKSWKLKNYRSVSTAIEEFLESNGLPQRRQHIIEHLDGEFAEGNITAALSTETRFKSIGDGIYDRLQNWQKRTLDGLIEELADHVSEFAHYLTGRNNTSYKLVMAYVFIRSMDDQGSIYLFKLKDMFYNFYLSRYKKGLPVEIDTAAMSRIAELTQNEIKNQSCKRPIESFLNSPYFVRYSENGKKLKLTDWIFSELRTSAIKDILLIVILKAIDNYFQLISPDRISYVEKSGTPPKDTNSVSEENRLFQADPLNNASSTLNIKKKRRGKIRL